MLEQQDPLNTWLMQMARGAIAPEDQKQLEERMVSDPEVLAYCQDFFVTCANLEQILRSEEKEQWGQPPRYRRLVGWGTAVAAVLVILIVLGFLLLPPTQEPTGPTAQLIDSRALKWALDCDPCENTVFYGSHALEILEGIAKFRMGDGTQIILKGPSRFTLEDCNCIYLGEGMLTAHVPKSAQGFVVNTRQAKIVDLGTEFGVLAWQDGTIETQVFSGLVDVWPSDANQALHLSSGHQALIDSDGEAQSYNQSQTQAYYIQHLPHETPACPGKSLDLADIVGGGNGFGYGVLNQGIDPKNGAILTNPAHMTLNFDEAVFTPIPNHPYIDGVFLPQGQSGSVLISTADHAFKGFPATRGKYYDGIFNGVKLYAEEVPSKTFQGRLQGITYGTYERPAINCHPNAGMTFDLQAIRRDNPGILIQSFRSLCGLNDIAPWVRQSHVEFWVLVDGQLQAHHVCGPNEQAVGTIDVPLARDARFLTLATTADGGIHYCWSFFAEPTLILSTVN